MEIPISPTIKDKGIVTSNPTDKGKRIVITIKPIAEPRVRGPTPTVVKIKGTEISSRIVIRTNRGTVLIRGIRASFKLEVSHKIRVLLPLVREAGTRRIELVSSAKRGDI